MINKGKIMSTYTILEQFNVAVIRSTIKEELEAVAEEAHPQTLKMMCLSGGALCLNITEQYLAAIQSSEMVTAEAKAIAATYKPLPTVVLINDFFTEHSEEEKQAVMFHEIGHIVADHVSTANTSKVDENGFLSVLEYELQADAFAAEMVSKQAMAAGLKKCIVQVGVQIQKSANRKKLAFDAAKFQEQAFSEPMYVARLAALQ